jgi:2-methylcitrate dehydratase PrpD
MALGIAASQPVGLREQFGTMTKPFHPGGAARAGLMSALMASHGFTASPRALEAPRGFMQVASDQARLERDHRRAGPAVRDLVQHLQAVCLRHRDPPSIDACVQLRPRASRPSRWPARAAGAFAGAGAHRQEGAQADGLQAKFSVYHGCAAGLIFGRAGEDEYHDAVVNDPRVVATRAKVNAIVDDSINEESVHVTAVLNDGRQIVVEVQHAIGSLQNPLSDAQLQGKFTALVEPVLGAARAADITGLCRSLGTVADVRTLTALCRAAGEAP